MSATQTPQRLPSPSPPQTLHTPQSNLRAPSPARSPSPGQASGVGPGVGLRATAGRQSLGPAPRGGLASPRVQMRPNSELIGQGTWGGALPSAGLGVQSPEAAAIDQWFENLGNYEATLEEMAAASMDQNFKEELVAIEQWFRVLSEAERTAALYSLLQHSTQVQIRFFITVLQQMARSDPMTAALLSPAVGKDGGSMESQMEAKLAQMGLKSPGLGGPKSPSVSSPNRQSSGDTLLSPDDALAQHRARLKANRISAPGNLPGPGTLGGSPIWNQGGTGGLEQVAERRSPSPSGRPKSTDFSVLATGSPSPLHRTSMGPGDFDLAGTAAAVDQQLSPLPSSGNWASMVNTPLIPMFAPGPNAADQARLDGASAELANWPGAGAGASSNIRLDDARKFRRQSKNNGVSGGALSGMYANEDQQRSPSGFQGAAAAQGWAQRNSPLAAQGRFDDLNSNSNGNGLGGQMDLASLSGLGMGSPNLALLSANNPLLAMQLQAQQQQLQLLQQQQAVLAAANQQRAAAGGGLRSGGVGGGFGAQGANGLAGLGAMGMGGFGGMGMGMGGMFGGGVGLGGGIGPAPKRSPAKLGGASPSRPGGGEDEVDERLLKDVPAWLRALRLHKYTPNFEGSKWQDMVVMDDAALEAKGVAAVGARRKMLKEFEKVRAHFKIPAPPASSSPATSNDSATDKDDSAAE